MRVQPLKETVVFAAGVLICLAMIAVLAHGIWEQFDQLRRINDAQSQLRPYLDHEWQMNDHFSAEVERVLSPEYVEEWARVYGGLVRAKEVRIVISSVRTEVASPAR